MIFILSHNIRELTTEEVMDWLYAINGNFKRVNGDILFTSGAPYSMLIGNDGQVSNRGLNSQKESINVIWFRRWLNYQKINSLEASTLPVSTIYSLQNHLKLELSKLSQYWLKSFSENVKWIDPPNQAQINKLNTLKLANSLGLLIPETLITNGKSEILAFKKKYGKIITKPIGEVEILSNLAGNYYSMYTKEVKQEDIERIGNKIFYPSLFQELLEKRLDLRIFYLDNHFYTMAIFSQRRKDASIDFRNYDLDMPDRMVPYKLPQSIELKLKALVDALNMKHCSIDIVLTTKGLYYFLEVNPVGQFGMVSKPCNYYLEMKLANYLKRQDES